MFTQTFFSMALAASAAVAAPASGGVSPKCPMVFDGRVPVATTPEFFDTAATNTIFNADYVKGNNLTWSQILKFPKEKPSRFGCGFKAVEVTISDASIFQKQKGFRRAELQFLKDAPDGEGFKGVKTLHWSTKLDAARPLNLSHEYLNVWHEAADYSNNQIQFQSGALIGKSDADKNNFKLLDSKGNQLFAVPMEKTSWQNFATTLDVNKNEVTVYYSVGTSALKKVAGPLNVTLSGGGQYHFGLLKKPTGTSDVVNAGFQESPLNEGLIYDGIFLEDSSKDCVSL